KIQEDVNGKINSMQRDFFLKEQLKVIKKELGMEEDGKDKSSRTFRERIDAAKMPEAVKKIALEELAKFETLSEQSPEYNVSRTYLETICALPWGVYTEDQLDLDRAEKILDEDHYGLEKVKARIVEFLAVRNLRQEAEAARQVNTAKEKPAKLAAKSARPLTGNGVSPPSETAPPAPAAEIAEATKKKGSIICLVGPPGVGKTSMGKSIARTLGRQFYRFSLGGMRDEAEIKGHRRTYIGAMPGKIVNAMKRAGSKNPVIMLDEIDKLGASFQGDPASALLEVLDPEQNASFLDHYLDIPFDLSDVLFIATANTTASIPAPLLDRMEVIEIAGYTLEEKELIANRYVIPKILQETGIPENLLKLHTAALTIMMKDYAREPGLRSLQMLVEKIARKAAADIVREKKRAARIKSKPKAISITPENLRNWIGPPRFFNELAERIISPGVVVGLAWTAAGGDILFIEATDLIGTGGFKLTGKMGEVMTESANIAWTYVKKKYAQEQAVKPEFFKERDVHVHIPAGAIPKDGPSAGISMATALYSLLTGRMSRQKLAMTGELSLTGKVLPVGGIKEKLLAAKRAGITEVILPRLNRKDLEEVPKYALEGMRIHFVDHVESVFKLALDEKKPRGLKKADAAKKVLRKGMRVRPASGRPTRSGARA
ncbi:MAG: endopeptidase La, partial [Bacteriovoracia bacterium]